MSYCNDTYGSLSIPEMLNMIESRDKVIAHADKMIEQVLPQAGGIVLDIGVANELCMGITQVKREQNYGKG
jgi:hypothetical protein